MKREVDVPEQARKVDEERFRKGGCGDAREVVVVVQCKRVGRIPQMKRSPIGSGKKGQARGARVCCWTKGLTSSCKSNTHRQRTAIDDK